jgi:hypothetical protein
MIERFAAVAMALALLVTAAGPARSADSPAQLAALIRAQLVYPRQARYVLPPRLPVETSTPAQNAEWLRVAQALSARGILKTSVAAGKTILEPAERSTDAIVPSVSLRYETTALNVVLGYWDVEVRDARRDGEVTTVQGTRHMVRRTRAYDLVLATLDSRHAADFFDRDVAWEISVAGAAVSVRETRR